MRDINLLPNSPGDDPRTLEKLADGVNNTFDDEHMWLAPYDPQCVEFFRCTFAANVFDCHLLQLRLCGFCDDNDGGLTVVLVA